MSSVMSGSAARALAADVSSGEGAAVLREVARLHANVEDLKKRILRVYAIAGGLAVLLALTVSATVFLFPKYRWIATLDNRAICEVASEDNPRITPASLVEYAKNAVIESNTYDYLNYRDQLNQVADKWYTRNGRKAFFESLDQSGNLERVIKGTLLVRAMSTQVPQLEEEGRLATQQRYWKVLAPIAIEFYAGGDTKPRTRTDFLATVTIVQVPASAVNLKGIGIESIALGPAPLR